MWPERREKYKILGGKGIEVMEVKKSVEGLKIGIFLIQGGVNRRLGPNLANRTVVKLIDLCYKIIEGSEKNSISRKFFFF